MQVKVSANIVNVKLLKYFHFNKEKHNYSGAKYLTNFLIFTRSTNLSYYASWNHLNIFITATCVLPKNQGHISCTKDKIIKARIYFFISLNHKSVCDLDLKMTLRINIFALS